MIRVAVAELGAVSRTHLAAITACSNAQLAAVCDVKPEKGQVVPGVPFYTDLEQMLDKEKPDCRHVCLPHYLHIPAVEVELVPEHGRLKIQDDCLWKKERNTWVPLAPNIFRKVRKSYSGTGHQSASARFYKAIEEDTADYITLSDALPVMRSIEGISQSSAAGKKVEL